MKEIINLVAYAYHVHLIEKEDIIYIVNNILGLMEENGFDNVEEKVLDEEKSIEEDKIKDGSYLDNALNNLINLAYDKNIITENSIAARDLFDTRLMGLLTPRPSEVIKKFRNLYAENASYATNWYYDFSQNTDYIRKYRVSKDIKWTTKTEYGDLDITINMSKPEKDPRDIEKSSLFESHNYPKCVLCRESEGFFGHIGFPARENHRIIPVDICGDKWFFQYSPYAYYNEHCIVLNSDHIPMKIDNNTFCRLFDFVKKFPHYFIGSNADLPIVGGSILSHDHFQGGNYKFAMAKAQIEREFEISGFEDIKCGIVKWPMSVIRLSGNDTERIVNLADKILNIWRNYTDEESSIYAYTGGVSHNTITPIARKNGEVYELDLVLRNNCTAEEYPYGIFHPHEEYHHIKKENIGLIEVMGLAILPARLKHEMEKVKEMVLNNQDIGLDEEVSKHSEWVYGFLKKYDVINAENIDEILKNEIGIVFEKILENAGVFKRTVEGQKAFDKFIESFK